MFGMVERLTGSFSNMPRNRSRSCSSQLLEYSGLKVISQVSDRHAGNGLLLRFDHLKELYWVFYVERQSTCKHTV
jgi:hypothetical protein